jgi:hypothetical protein
MVEENMEPKINSHITIRLFDRLEEMFKHEPYLESMNAILSHLTHEIYHAYNSKKKRRESIKHISEALLNNLIYMEKNGCEVLASPEDNEARCVSNDGVGFQD